MRDTVQADYDRPRAVPVDTGPSLAERFENVAKGLESVCERYGIHP